MQNVFRNEDKLFSIVITHRKTVCIQQNDPD